MYFCFIFNYSGIFVIIISVFCLSVLNGVCCKCDVLVLKGYYNNDRIYVDLVLIVYELLFVKGI